MKEIRTITIVLNGTEREFNILPDTLLLDLIRSEAGLKGTKGGCRQGHCGACTVLMDGYPVASCIVLALQADGKRIDTIESLSQDGKLHPIQQAFIDESAVQCGFCTPGMVMSSKSLLDENPDPDEDEIRQALAGNICRCTGYTKIFSAVKRAAKVIRDGEEKESV